MKKKLLTLCALLLSVGSVLAEEVTVSLIGAKEKHSSKTEVTVPTIETSSQLITTGVCGSSCAVSDYHLSTADGKTVIYNNNTYYLSSPYDANGKNKIPYNTTGEVNQYGTFTIPDGYTYTINKISHALGCMGFDSPTGNIIIKENTSVKHSESVSFTRNSNDNTEIYATTISIGGIELVAGTYTINLSATSTNTGTGKYYGFAEIVLTGDLVALSTPTIRANDAEITAKESGVPATVDIDVVGSNLTGTTLTAEISPEVEGLSVKLNNSTITAGSISTTATITYTATENAEGTTTLTLTDGNISKEVTISYKAAVEEWTLQTISEAKTWDFSKLTANTESGRYDSSSSPAGIKLDANSTPSKNDEVVYENYNGEGGDIAIGSEFDGKAIAFKGTYPIRNNQYCQDGVLRFYTSVPGKVVVTFSNTGKDNQDRYVNVNGIKGKIEAVGTDKKEETFYILAGDVAIEGVNENALRFYNITFTPVENVEVTFGNEDGYRTWTCEYPTDWSEVKDVTAYTAKLSGMQVTFEKVTGSVPAGEGMLLVAANPATKTYTIPVATETPADIENDFIGVTVETPVNHTIYVLYKKNGTVAFYQTTADVYKVGANTAYIDLPETTTAPQNAPAFIAIPGVGGDGTTSLNAIENKVTEDGKMYDLQGRQVTNPAKGLYIKNGKKYIVK